MKYRFAGKEKLLAFGPYPEVSLKDARDQRDDARRLLRAGADPCGKREAERVASAATFEAIAREWLSLKSASLDARTFKKKQERFETFALF